MASLKFIEKAKDLKTVFGIEWLLVIVAIAYFDGSAAMLLLMFGSPLFFAIRFVFKFLEKKKLFIPGKKTRGASVLLAVIAALSIISWGLKEHSPQKLFQSLIIDPVPTSVKNIETRGSINAMGSSSFFMTFEISHSDFELILKSGKFHNYQKIDVEKMPERVQHCLRERLMNEINSLMENISEVYVYTHSNSKYRCDFIIINKDHNKALYGSK